MNNREIAIDLIQRLPEGASLHEIAREIEFIAGVREGFEELERGKGVPAEKVREMVSSWTVKQWREETVPVPQWHKNVLDERQRAIADGKARFIDWETAKKRIAGS